MRYSTWYNRGYYLEGYCHRGNGGIWPVLTSAIKLAVTVEPVGYLFLSTALQHFGLGGLCETSLEADIREIRAGRLAMWHGIFLIPREEDRERYTREAPHNWAPFCRTVVQLREQYRSQEGVGVMRTSQVFGFIRDNSPDAIMCKLVKEMLDEGPGSSAEQALAVCANPALS